MRTKSGSPDNEPASDGVVVSDLPQLGGLYRSAQGGFCVVIGFATELETGEEVVAFVSLEGKHYVRKVRTWMGPTKNPTEKRFTRIPTEDLIRGLGRLG